MFMLIEVNQIERKKLFYFCTVVDKTTTKNKEYLEGVV